jgi:hypothetical protein
MEHMNTKFSSENVKGRSYVGDTDVDWEWESFPSM